MRKPLSTGMLQAGRQCPGPLGQESAVERQELGNIDDRVPGQARQFRPQQYIARGIGKICVARDHRRCYGLNAAAIKRICLDHKHGTPVTRLGPARCGKVGPPNLSSLDLVHFLPAFLVEGTQLGAEQRRVYLRVPTRIHLVQAFGDGVGLLPAEEFRNDGSIQLTSRNPKTTGSRFRQTEKIEYNPRYTKGVVHKRELDTGCLAQGLAEKSRKPVIGGIAFGIQAERSGTRKPGGQLPPIRPTTTSPGLTELVTSPDHRVIELTTTSVALVSGCVPALAPFTCRT